MKAIERANTHFAEQDVKVIKVPEWGEEDKPLEIYSKPLTLSETSKLYKMSTNDDLTMMAYVLIYKALDADGNKLFDIGNFMKGLAMGGVAAAKAILPGGESPGEAFKRVFDSYTKGNEISTDVQSGTEIAKITSEDVRGNVTEQTYKTNTINNSSNNNQGAIVYNDQSTKQVANTNYAKNETYTGSLNVSIDPYFDRSNTSVA